MNQANTVCLLAIIFIMFKLAGIFCFGLNPYDLGGWGPAMLMVVLPIVGYTLGRIYND